MKGQGRDLPTGLGDPDRQVCLEASRIEAASGAGFTATGHDIIGAHQLAGSPLKDQVYL